MKKMEKSSFSSLERFRKFFTQQQTKSYKISPGNSYHSTEIKLNGLNTTSFDDSINSHNIDDVYSLKKNKIDGSDSATKSEQNNIPNIYERIISGCSSTFCLTVLTPVACSFSVIIIVAAIAGPLWISTEERIPYYAVNSTFYRSNYTLSYIIKSSNASLWIFCTRQALDDNRATKLDFTQKNCTRISFLSLDPYQQDLTDFTTEPTYVIPYTITLSTPLLIISFIILLTSYLLFLLAICSHKYKIFYFAAGIGFIISGLLSLSGLIMFISIFKSEVYHKLKTEPMSASSSREASFSFNYGQSFHLYVIGFVVVELSGILNVCLYSRLQASQLIGQQRRRNENSNSNYVKVGAVDVDSSKINGICHHTMKRNDQMSHSHHINVNSNGFLPHQQQQSCSFHVSNKGKSAGNLKSNDLLHHKIPPTSASTPHHAIITTFDEQNFHENSTMLKMRNASTSTLDLVNSSENGDGKSGKNNQRVKSSKLDFNNFFGRMKRGSTTTSTTKNEIQKSPHHVLQQQQRVGRVLKPAKNVYFIDEPREDEPNIFIIDAETINNKHKRIQYMRKSLEDIHNHEQSLNKVNDYEPWNFASRNSYGSRTLPRDFCRRNVRTSLHNFLDTHHQHHQLERTNIKRHCSHNHLVDTQQQKQLEPCSLIPPPNGFAFHHSCSFDELSNQSKFNNNNNLQWPKVIPKSPSTYSVNSLRHNHHYSHHSDIPSPPPPPTSSYGNNNNIVEFDLEKIEKEFRRSHSNLLNRDFGTAV